MDKAILHFMTLVCIVIKKLILFNFPLTRNNQAQNQL